MMGVGKTYDDALAHLPVLHTSRLVLRRPTEQDVPAIVEIAGDWEVASRLARMPHPYSEENARFFLEEIVPKEMTWSIIERASGEIVGVIGLAPCEQGGDRIELGYYIGRAHWGRGIATEAGAAIAAYGAGLVGQRRLRSGYFTDNPASGRVLEKLGFVRLHISERPCLTTGETKPSVEMGYPDR
jgi:RimJ/RimL family protein N-acetyltransferase